MAPRFPAGTSPVCCTTVWNPDRPGGPCGPAGPCGPCGPGGPCTPALFQLRGFSAPVQLSPLFTTRTWPVFLLTQALIVPASAPASGAADRQQATAATATGTARPRGTGV